MIFPSILSSVMSPVPVVEVLVKRTWELMLRGKEAPQGDQMTDVKGMVSLMT